MFGSILGDVLSGLSGGLIGNKDKAQLPGFHGSGWIGDRDGRTAMPLSPAARHSLPEVMDEGVPALEPLVENAGPQEKGWYGGLNQFLGSDVGRLGVGIASGFLDDARSQRATKKRFEFLKRQGLNPYEIAGGGASGGQVPAQGSTLGNAPNVQSMSQQEHERNLQRAEHANRIAIARISQEAPHRQAGASEEQAVVARGHLELAQQLNPLQVRKLDGEIRKIDAETRRIIFDLENYWAQKYATMSPQNVLMSLASYQAGISVEDILKGMPGQDPEAVERLIDDFISFQSVTRRESRGVTEFVEDVGRKTGLLSVDEDGKNVLGEGATGALDLVDDVFRPFGLPRAIYDRMRR